MCERTVAQQRSAFGAQTSSRSSATSSSTAGSSATLSPSKCLSRSFLSRRLLPPLMIHRGIVVQSTVFVLFSSVEILEKEVRKFFKHIFCRCFQSSKNAGHPLFPPPSSIPVNGSSLTATVSERARAHGGSFHLHTFWRAVCCIRCRRMSWS